MRLWHQDLISKLPRPQLLGQHRECCALRGNGWGKKHATVSPEWWEPTYRGKTCPAYPELEEEALSTFIYPEHQATYLQECLDNLAEKGIQLD